jgi:glutamate synthase (NADPH/NADH) small chain
MPAKEKQAVPMREQDPRERTKNFNEVPFGYSEEEAVREAQRCLGCKKPPCVPGCPVQIDIPTFIGQIAQSDFAAAYGTIMASNSLPAICGRVCPQEEQCQKNCLAGKVGDAIQIGKLERFVADWAVEHATPPTPSLAKRGNEHGGVKVAIIGSGPSGLTCAADLAKRGYRVTIFEALHEAGGVLLYGIPEFRLPKKIIRREIKQVEDSGVEVYCNAIVGKLFTIEELMTQQGYAAVFIGAGAGLPTIPKLKGDQLAGVYSANEYLTRINMMQAYKFPDMPTPVNVGERVGVMGGGNVAMDSARNALRMGAHESHIIYRRSAEELPARAEEVEHAHEEGVIFDFLCNPLELLGDDKNHLTGVKCIRMELGDPDASGRRSPVPIAGSEFEMQLDCFIIAVGQSPNPILTSTTPALKTKKWGYIETNPDTLETSIPGVFAGGDIIGGSTVIQAMGDGKKAAQKIAEWLER